MLNKSLHFRVLKANASGTSPSRLVCWASEREDVGMWCHGTSSVIASLTSLAPRTWGRPNSTQVKGRELKWDAEQSITCHTSLQKHVEVLFTVHRSLRTRTEGRWLIISHLIIDCWLRFLVRNMDSVQIFPIRLCVAIYRARSDASCPEAYTTVLLSSGVNLLGWPHLRLPTWGGW